ncbi:restriction endonuclease [candidate division WOR-3 bacterium JGI_Cruoil_03_51_56]|uniref:Restriction endonuclease n=1 Tax=candidate division WOR-3 bacterium JGI_Cruoil_03_51_56 TaxID=1973747 RepID=A0A235BRS6_UNCW3|nr:MAG: restriction endonuclease [candidate division WOR-3 bacterium JGI_Cruoil_03_51_56]
MTNATKPYLEHLDSAIDLVTTYEATRAGFVTLALEKSKRATPFVEQARALKVQASKASGPEALLTMKDLHPALLTAAGLSDKAKGHLTDGDKIKAIEGLIEQFLRPAGARFVEELVYRFLLTRGDALGGSMRNLAGEVAEQKVTAAIVSVLAIRDSQFTCRDAQGVWGQVSASDKSGSVGLKGLGWRCRNEPRTLVFNRKVPLSGSNVDMCLLHCGTSEADVSLRAPERYIALGELKGGIDPAGADEHWKTARTALNRITQAFGRNRLSPATFFIGAAIEKNMAAEIWSMLESRTLTNAANLTDNDQLSSLCHWLCSL